MSCPSALNLFPWSKYLSRLYLCDSFLICKDNQTNILQAKVSQVVQISYFYEVEVPSTVKIQAAWSFQKKTFQEIAEKKLLCETFKERQLLHRRHWCILKWKSSKSYSTSLVMDYNCWQTKFPPIAAAVDEIINKAKQEVSTKGARASTGS